MRVATAVCGSVAVLVVSPAMAWVEYLVEGTSTEELSEDLIGITEHEREPAKDKFALERIVRVSSALRAVVVISVAAVVVSYQSVFAVLIVNSTLFLCKNKQAERRISIFGSHRRKAFSDQSDRQKNLITGGNRQK